MLALINFSAVSDGTGRMMVYAREKPVYPSLSQLACQSTYYFMKLQLSFLITNWLMWKSCISSNSPAWQAYWLKMDNSSSYYCHCATAEEWAFHSEGRLFHVVLLCCVIRGKQSERGKEYSLKWQLVFSKYLCPVTAKRDPFQYVICAF